MKIILLILGFFFYCNLNAQINKGSIFFGGDFSFSSSTYKSNNPADNTRYPITSSFNFSPSAGKAIKDNLVVGGKILLSFFKYEYYQNPPVNQDKGNNVGASIYVRKYVPLAKSFFLFGDASLGGQSIYRKGLNQNTPDYFHSEKGFLINASLYPGIAYQLNKSFFIEMALSNLVGVSYTNTHLEQQGQNVVNYKSKYQGFNFYTGIGNAVPLQVGVKWMIAKHS